MSETCAVCKQGKGPEKCEICGFSDNGAVNRNFITKEDAEFWLTTVVKPYRVKWEAEKREIELQAQLENAKQRETELLARIKELETQLETSVKPVDFTISAVRYHSTYQIGNIITFGNYDWQILDVKNDKALIISVNIIEERIFSVAHSNAAWETCILRKYLNNDFLKKFANEHQNKIINSRIINKGNLWYEKKDIRDTSDKIFLLSLDEADKYFGNSGNYQNKKRKISDNGKYITDSNGSSFSNIHDISRVSKLNNKASEWWLRSPGLDDYTTAIVNDDGSVRVFGYRADVHTGVRPALWLNLN